MVQIRVNPNLTEEDVPALVAELEKLSSLNPVKDVLVAAGKPLEPLPSEKMQGSRPRENEVFLKDYVDGALELAQMLGIEDQGTISPSKGLSFRAKNFKFYDFMGYWSALIKRFSANEERMTVFEQDGETIARLLADAEQNDKDLASNSRSIFDYAVESRKRADKKIEALQAQGALFEEAAILMATHAGDFVTKAKQLDQVTTRQSNDIIELKKQIKKIKRQFFWFAVLTGVSSLWFYGTLLLKII